MKRIVLELFTSSAKSASRHAKRNDKTAAWLERTLRTLECRHPERVQLQYAWNERQHRYISKR